MIDDAYLSTGQKMILNKTLGICSRDAIVNRLIVDSVDNGIRLTPLDYQPMLRP